jgi:hypothetical protein
MEKGQYGNRPQVETWFKDAPADDAIHGTVAGLKRIAGLPMDEQRRFVEAVTNDPVANRLFEELQTNA